MSLKEAMLNKVLELISNIPPEEWKLTPQGKALFNKNAAGLLEPIRSPRELNLTYAKINYWEEKGYLLLPTPKETDQWRKFSTLEVLWIEILKETAKMGCALDIIAPKLIFAYSNKHRNNETIPYDYATPLYAKDNVDGIRITPTTTFLFHILEIFIHNSKASIHFFRDRCQFTFESGTDKSTSANTAYNLIYNTGISICISDILFKYILGQGNSPSSTGQVFSEDEIEILNLLKNNQLKEVTIKLENGKPVSVDLKEQFDIPIDDTSKRLKEFFSSPYQAIKATTNGGKTISFERTTKRKLRK